MSEIKPAACPFCGDEEVDPMGWMDGRGSSGPQCTQCGATAESVEAWNRRAPQPAKMLMADEAKHAVEVARYSNVQRWKPRGDWDAIQRAFAEKNGISIADESGKE